MRLGLSSTYRRRPPRTLPSAPTSSSLLPVFALLSLVAICASAQTTQGIDYPFTTTVILGSAASTYFHLASPSSLPVWISLSLCSVPTSLSANESFVLPSELGTTLFVSNSSSIQAPGPANTAAADGADGTPRLDDSKGATSALTYGYANATLAGGADGGIWIGVYAPSSAALGGADVAGNWTFELEVSSGASLAPYVADGGASFRLGDTDASTVLLRTANYTAAGEAGDVPPWQSLVAPTQRHALALGRSSCAVKAALASAVGRTDASSTTSGYGGGARRQFVVDGLERGTNYTAWLVSTETMSGGGGNQTRVWDPVLFATKSGDSCRLVYGLDVCPGVAYAVPSPLSLDTPSLVSYFNSTLATSLANFSRTLTTFPCGSKGMGLYSIVSTCDDCYAAYRDWLCATTLPRCTDAPSNATLNDTSAAIASTGDLASWFLPEGFATSLVRDDPAASRTPLFGPANLSTAFPDLFNASYPPTAAHARAESPFSYAEVPPCLDVCYLVEARCPPFLGWKCPRGSVGDLQGGTGSAAYGVTREVPEEARQAGDVANSGLQARAADRYGNVFCNALDSDLVQAAQFVPWTSGAAVSLPPGLRAVLLCSTLVVLAFSLGLP